MNSIDAIMGFPGQHAFRSELGRLLEAGEPFALLSVDIDGLKPVNGFAAYRRGDSLLRRAGQAVAAASPGAARVFRFGGDEFAVLLPADVDCDAVDLGERICAAVAAVEIPAGGKPGPTRVSCSVGVARFPVDGRTDLDLLGAVDMGVFLAKHMGGGRVVDFGTETGQRARGGASRGSTPGDGGQTR